MHRDLSELQTAPARSRRAQQHQCDRWVVDFNHVRPHEALDGKTPSELYRNSSRRLGPSLIPNYPPDWLTRRATNTGSVRVNGDNVFVNAVVAGQILGLKQETEIHWRVRYFDIDMGTIEILPIHDAFCTESVIRSVNAIEAKMGLKNLASGNG